MRSVQFLAFESAWIGVVVTVAAQCQSQRLEPPAPRAFGEFGRPLMSDGRLVICDRRDAWLCPTTQDCSGGAVHAYTFDNGEGRWVFSETVRPSDLDFGYAFGYHGAIDGDRMIVSAPFSDLGEPGAGAVYVFEAEGDKWYETAQIAPAEPGFLHEFGCSVAIYNDLALVADLSDSVWVYEYALPGWTMREKLKAPDGLPLASAFGVSMAIDANWLFIGATFDATHAPQGGSVYVFRRDGANFEYIQKLVPPDVETMPRFGSVFVDGTTLAVGGYNSDREVENQGAIYIYELSDGQWRLRQEVTHRDPHEDDQLGTPTLIGDTLIAGALRRKRGPNMGAIYVFRRDASGQWAQAREIPQSGVLGLFPGPMVTDGRQLVVSAKDDTSGGVPGAGSAIVYDLDCLICRPDLDGDGELTFFDFLAFGNLFAAGDMRADFDGSGDLDLFDFLAFQTAFDAGCP
ncbi:MAG: GC-type dockerin domain-anchored protein [Phycisphaerales bacterium JB039]